MKIYGVIPLRSGSKSIPYKNIKVIAGKPLAQWTVDCCNSSNYINETFIAIDDVDVFKFINNTSIFLRSKESAFDDAPTIQVIKEFCEGKDLEDIIVLLQSTSPLTEPQDIDKGIDLILSKKFDSCLSVVRQKKFIWSEDGVPINYDISKRPRRQNWNGILVENGAFYISTVGKILSENNFLCGNIGMVEMHSDTYYEIDEESDWNIVEFLLSKKRYT